MDDVTSSIEKMEKTWITYDIKFEGPFAQPNDHDRRSSSKGDIES
jgi:hypothetical protein